jgi:hypothetical protein
VMSGRYPFGVGYSSCRRMSKGEYELITKGNYTKELKELVYSMISKVRILQFFISVVKQIIFKYTWVQVSVCAYDIILPCNRYSFFFCTIL